MIKIRDLKPGDKLWEATNKLINKRIQLNGGKVSGLKTRHCRNGICIHFFCVARIIARRDGIEVDY